MTLHSYGDIPDDNFTKEFMLISKHIFIVYRHLGLDYMESVFPKFRQVQYDVTKARWDNMIYTGRKIISGDISKEEAEKTFLYTVPHVVTCRSDLQVGTNKLLYGDSVDVSFAIINDYTLEILFVFNGHLEDGVPVDWWLAGLNDDLMERRHLKYGIKLREVPKKAKSLLKSAQWLESILKDVRNERTPHFSESLYTISMCFSSAMFNIFAEQSCYETMASIYDGMNAKRIYKIKDYHFLYYPVPPMFNTLFMLPRDKFTKSIEGLTTSHKLITNTIEDGAMEWVKTELSEVYPISYLPQWTTEGIPIPAITLGTQIPSKKKDMIGPDGWLKRDVPKGSRLTLENMDITEEESNKGYLFDIDHETPLDVKLTPDLKISMGMGAQTKFFK
ncbi:MAG: hypothetical protein ACXQS8_09245 [Candidatus Helarchaeales archaeon]